MELTQRFLVNRRIRTADGEVHTKYVFPFWDRDWKVVLTLLDRFGAAPAIAREPLRFGTGGHPTLSVNSKDLEPAERWNPEGLRDLFHYDPWWVFRGIGGVPEPVKMAILPTNIAKPFRHDKREWKVHDVIFDPNDGRVEAIEAKNEVFHRREFTHEDLDLETTWPKVRTRRH